MQPAQEHIALRKFDLGSMTANSTILILGRRRSGKCFAPNTPVLMYGGGFKYSQNLKEGDLLIGDNNKPRKVISTHTGTDMMYTVSTTTGDSYTVTEDHLLCLYFRYKKSIKRYKNGYIVMWFCDKTVSIKHRLFYSDLLAMDFFTSIVENRYISISVKDYLGLKRNVMNNLCGYKVVPKFTDTFLKDSFYKGYTLNDNLYIKDSYLYGSISTRLAFLKGVIKRHGTVIANSIVIRISNFSERVVSDLFTMITLLCYQCAHTGNTLVIKGKGLSYLSGNPTQKYFEQHFYHSILSVHPKGVGTYYGVEVDGNHKYLLSNCSVVHNSWLVRDIFYHHKNIPKGLIFSGTEKANPFYGDFVPDIFIYPEYNGSVVSRLFQRQSQKIKKAKENGHVETDGRTNGNRVFVVLDDLLHQASVWTKEETIKDIFFNGRHYNIFFILTMQYPLGIPPPLRSNIDYVFVFNDSSIKNRKKIYEDYAGMIPTFGEFCNILEQCSQDHGCLVIQTSGNSVKLQDQIFWYKAELRKDFKVGHPSIWDFYKKKYTKTEKTDDDYNQGKKLKIIINKLGETVKEILH